MKRSSLEAKLTAYLSLREALGKPIQSKLILKNFVEYLDHQNRSESISVHVVMNWVCNTAQVQGVSAQYARFFLARGFLIYLKASLPETEIPDSNLIAKPRRSNPYIFSATELRKALTATQELEADTQWSVHARTAETLFALMACTGLRSSEAIKLTLPDLQLDESPPRLLIRCAKFNKSRLVPLHSTAADRLRDYLRWRQKCKFARFSDVLFLSKKGQRVNYQVLRRLFLRGIQHAEIHARSGQLRPSMHSLRHSFAVQRVRRWYEEGVDVRALLPGLSVYLGHSNPASSYWYLSATPELMSAASLRFEDYAATRGAI